MATQAFQIGHDGRLWQVTDPELPEFTLDGASFDDLAGFFRSVGETLGGKGWGKNVEPRPMTYFEAGSVLQLAHLSCGRTTALSQPSDSGPGRNRWWPPPGSCRYWEYEHQNELARRQGCA